MKILAYRLSRFAFFLFVFASFSFQLNAVVTHRILITEFLALNSTGLKDVDGEPSDWIELYNPGESAVDLTGWHLTDRSDEKTQWAFPSVSLGAGQYMVVWASGKDGVFSGQLHTNFKLSGGGEYLALVESDTNNIAYEYAPTFPAQQTDQSYGIYLGQHTFLSTPTPGSGNVLGTQVLSPVFSKTRGFYSEPFSVTLSVADPEASIRYTTDGTRPTATKGMLYTGPISVSKTTPLSAVCVRAGSVSPVVSHTYFFVSDIVQQPALPAGYPERWSTMSLGLSTQYPAGSRAPGDYEMDPEVCNNAAYKNLMDEALTSIPTLSVVTNPGYLFSYSIDPDTGGIYIYTGAVAKDSLNSNTSLGLEWERPASIEYFDPSDSSQFQINCAVLLHGGNGRKPSNTPKHSFRFSFRSEYGASKLNFKVFDEKKATDRFDHLIARATYNNSWLKNDIKQQIAAQNMNDAFSRKLQLDMGQVSGHDKFVHLYLNGLYWGVFDLTEKYNNDFMESYFGGEDSDYDVINDDGVTDGSNTVYNTMVSKANNKDYNALVSDKLMDCTNFIDYMLMNFFIGNSDWDKNNWYAARNRVNPGNGFCWFSWDAETTLTDVNINKVTLVDGTPTRMFSALTGNAEFKMLLADRIQQHFFNGGALTPENTIRRWAQMNQKFDTAMIAESARWGDYYRDVVKTKDAELNTLNDHFLPRRDYLLNTYFPQRSDIVFNQLKAKNYVPTVSAPVYNTRGGKLLQPINLTMTAAAGTIYYTTDGSDPRLTGGSINTNAKTYSKALYVIGNGTVRARAKNGTVWSAVNVVSFEHEDTLHFIGDGTALPINSLTRPVDVFYAANALHYQLPVEGNVRVSLFTLDGRLAGRFEPGMQAAGSQSIEGLNLTSGVYLYRMQFNQEILTGKLIVE